MLLLHPVINRLQWEMLDLVFVLDLKTCPSFKLSLPLVEMFSFMGLFFLFYSVTPERYSVHVSTHAELSKQGQHVSSLQDSVMKRGDMLCRVIFSLCFSVSSQMAVVLVNLFFFFCGGEGSSPFINFTSLAPLKYEAIAFLSQMSYRLTFKFLSEQSDYFILF